jgi:hypothetical protein
MTQGGMAVVQIPTASGWVQWLFYDSITTFHPLPKAIRMGFHETMNGDGSITGLLMTNHFLPLVGLTWPLLYRSL